MMIKGVRPQTQLKLDALLFTLLGIVAVSALLEHTVAADSAHIRFMWHMLHGISGVAMCLTLGVHLWVHLPWIQSQLARWLGGPKNVSTQSPQ